MKIFAWGVYGIVVLEIGTDCFIEETIFKMVKNQINKFRQKDRR